MSVQKLPAPRPVLWPLRTQDSARVARSDDGGRRIITIEHAPLTGVTAEMLTWWYGHVPGTMPYADGMYPRYLVWHPLDHISYEVENNASVVGAGSRLHIVEAFGRELESVLDIHVTVERVDERSAVISRRVLGSSVVRLENEFESSSAGARYVTRMTLGDDTLPGWLMLNRVARTKALPPRKLEKWIRHHIEEIGNLEHFLPTLFDVRAPVEA
jgi:DAPG hydrolase PhiG domain